MPPKKQPPKKQPTTSPSSDIVVWRAANRTFRNAQEITTYIDGLAAESQVRAIEHLRLDLTRTSLQNDQFLHDIYVWLLARTLRGELREPDNSEAWRPVREAYLRVRNRRREGKLNLAGDDKWCTTDFWDQVVEPLTGGSRDVTDVLKLLRAKGTGPVEALQKGCREMFRRLSGESESRTRKDKHCTAGDLREGNINNPSTDRIDQGRFTTSGLGMNFHLDEYGFLWHHPPSISIAGAVHDQVEQDAARAQERAERRRPTRGPGQGSHADESDDNAGTPSPDGGPASRTRRGGRRTPAIKKPKLEQPSPGARQTAEMDKVFGQLNVISTKTARKRASSLKQQGKDESEWPSPDRMPIPVANSTKTQQLIWEVIEKRVKGIKFKQRVDISHEAAQAIKLPPAQLVQEIEAIAKGLSEAPATDDTLLVYTQCLLDAFRAQIVTHKGRTSEMGELRTIVGTWHHRFREQNVTLIPGSMWRGGVQLSHYDMTSLLLGDSYDGWLNGDLLHAILTVTAISHHVVPTRLFDWWHQGNHAGNMFDVPDDFPSLVVPIHWGNHWALLIADRATGQIYYLDSMEAEGRRQMAVASMRNFLNMHPGYNTVNWQPNPRRSAQQTNTYDCGVWAVCNAWAWADGTPPPTEVGLPQRLQIRRALLNAADAIREI